jgi:Heterokaryon incompatibility protein (HET)
MVEATYRKRPSFCIEHRSPLQLNLEDDTQYPMLEVRNQYGKSLVLPLLQIQKHRTAEAKSIVWAQNLQCLFRAGGEKVLHRTSISKHDATTSAYVAVSYPWKHSRYENSRTGSYRVEQLPEGYYRPSKVRDVILDRVVRYVEHHKLLGFWIDQECINQGDPKEKEAAMQSMDLVYRLSDHPLGLLSVPIRNQLDLNLLLALLKGDFVEMCGLSQSPRLKRRVRLSKVKKIVALLHYIVSDQWWDRAWIFQEEYCSSIDMYLLIPHHPDLIKEHAKSLLGSMQNELQVNATRFRQRSTLFCLAILRMIDHQWRIGWHLCKDILIKVKKYNVLYEHGHAIGDDNMGRPMSIRIFADIQRRHMSDAWDVLPIAANCCDYPIRLSVQALRRHPHSLSLSILVMFLLNGEILMNNKDDTQSLSGNIFHYMKQQLIARFDLPVRRKELTFLKHCRLVDVRLCPEGIETTGYLWQLRKKIYPRQFVSPLRPDHKESTYGLKRYHRAHLRLLAAEIRRENPDLANDIYEYLDEDAHASANQNARKRFMDVMAKEVVQAIRNGDTLWLGSIMGQKHCHAIFVAGSLSPPEPMYVFTAWEAGRHSSSIFSHRCLHKHVSLQVQCDKGTSQISPCLRTKAWVNGLCFFHHSSQRRVIFPWPASLCQHE